MRSIVSHEHRGTSSDFNSLLRFGAVALVAGLAAGCSADAVRLTDPIFTNSTNNQQSAAPGQQHASAQPVPPRPTGGVYANNSAIESRPLPQPPGANKHSVHSAAASTGYAAPRGTGPKPYTPPKAYVASGEPKPLGTLPVSASAAPRLESGSTVSTYKVQSGDSLWAIARRNGTTVGALRDANDINGNNIRLGQTIIIPNGAQTGNVRVASAAPATMNDADKPNGVPADRPETTDVAVAKPKQATDRPAPYTPPTAGKPDQPVSEAADAQTPETVASTTPPAATTDESGESGFRWPVRGRIISGFGKKPNGERNDGIDLAVPEGTDVKAAESGVVIYAGNELKSYGNLVLVKHENGWVSAYAHNKELLVKRGDNVQRGQVISRAGRSGGVDTPQVHFELRKGATPVDPMKYLSAV